MTITDRSAMHYFWETHFAAKLPSILGKHSGRGLARGCGPLPDEKSASQAKQLGARSGTKYGLAWVMFCRPDGASHAEIRAACGGPHFNAARDAQRAGKLDFTTGITKDRGRVYYIGPPGSHPGGLGVEPVGDDNGDGGEEPRELDQLSDAERVRLSALDQYIQPARERGDRTVSIIAGKLHNSLGLKQAHANVCQALGGEKFQRLANVAPPRIEGPEQVPLRHFISIFLEPLSLTAGTLQSRQI